MNPTDDILCLSKDNMDHFEDGQCRGEEGYHSKLLADELRINTDCEETRIVNDDDDYCDTLREASRGLIINGFKNDTNGRFDGEEVIFHKEMGKLSKTIKPIQKQVIEYDVVHQSEALARDDMHFSHGSSKALREI